MRNTWLDFKAIVLHLFNYGSSVTSAGRGNFLIALFSLVTPRKERIKILSKSLTLPLPPLSQTFPFQRLVRH